MRYSSKPIEDYGRTIQCKFYGPSESVFLREDAEAWNLAFLSYDFDKRPVHTDHHFTVNVRRTAQTRIDIDEIDLVGWAPGRLTVRSLLKLPAPRFVKEIAKNHLFRRLPMYEAYGPAWLETIRERSWLCETYHDDGGLDDDVGSTDEAVTVLRGIASRTR